MDFAYQPDVWHDFFGALATTYAALLGLFFVAISLHPHQVGEHPLLRSRARSTLVGLATLLLVALACLIPVQGAHALGVELVLIWTIWTVVLSVNQALLISRLHPVPVGVWLRTVGAEVMSLMGIWAGVSLGLGAGGGLLWNVAGCVLGLVIAFFNAWNVTFAPELLESVRAPASPMSALKLHAPVAASSDGPTARGLSENATDNWS